MKNCSGRAAKALLFTGAGVILSIAYTMLKRRREETLNVENESGTVPHTDFEAAAEIGRKTGGEVFDD